MQANTEVNDKDINEDALEFWKEFKIAQKEVFQWIRDEYKLPLRLQRDVDAINGDTWYRNYQIKECQAGNKSSVCSEHKNVKHESGKHDLEISDMLDDKDKPTWSSSQVEEKDDDSGGREAPTHRDKADDKTVLGRNYDENMKLEHLFPVSDHRDSNYSPNQLNIEARLSAKHILAKQQNAIHEIEMKHQHLEFGDSPLKGLSENQLRATSSNSNFPSTFNFDTSSSGIKRSSGQQQPKRQQRRFDDQLNQKRNDLFDEVDEKLSKKEQQGLQALHRVKRRRGDDDVEINRLETNEKQFNFDEFLQSHDGE